MTREDDTATIARQLADLTGDVKEMADQLAAICKRADTQRKHADTQQERIEIAARELNEVSTRLQAAAKALRESA